MHIYIFARGIVAVISKRFIIILINCALLMRGLKVDNYCFVSNTVMLETFQGVGESIVLVAG